MNRILVIEDEPDLALGLRRNLEFEGYEVVTKDNGRDGLEYAANDQTDLIILDVMLPFMSGMEVCRNLRSRGIETPIIMLTVRNQEVDKVLGLEIGANDYVTKPFSIRELLARIRVQLRSKIEIRKELITYRFGNLVVNFDKYLATKHGTPLELSPREFEILRYFIRHRGKIITRDELLNEVWGYEKYPITRTVDNHIARLRQKIEDYPADPRFIITVHRLGYKFIG